MPDQTDRTENLLGDDQTSQETNEPAEIDSLKESVGKMTENFNLVTQELSELKERLAQPEIEPEEEVEHYDPNRPGYTWDRVRNDWVKDATAVAEETVDRRLTEREELAEQERLANENYVKELDAGWDKELDDAVKSGIIPPIKDINDFDDPGRKARRQIFGLAAVERTMNLTKVADTISELNKVGVEFDVNTGKYVQVKTTAPGRFAPVGSSSGRSGVMAPKTISYQELHNSSIDELARKSMEE
jgi:regulator of replication initiation timing